MHNLPMIEMIVCCSHKVLIQQNILAEMFIPRDVPGIFPSASYISNSTDTSYLRPTGSETAVQIITTLVIICPILLCFYAVV